VSDVALHILTEIPNNESLTVNARINAIDTATATASDTVTVTD
jgi:hypothetical protein